VTLAFFFPVQVSNICSFGCFQIVADSTQLVLFLYHFSGISSADVRKIEFSHSSLLYGFKRNNSLQNINVECQEIRISFIDI